MQWDRVVLSYKRYATCNQPKRPFRKGAHLQRLDDKDRSSRLLTFQQHLLQIASRMLPVQF